MSPSAGARQVTITEAEAGGRLDKVLADALDDLSRSRLRVLIDTGQVSTGGRTIGDPSARVKPGQTFDIMIPELLSAKPVAQAIDLDIVYEDDDLLVVDGIDTIDASLVETGLMGHSYYGESRSVMSDLFDLLHNNSPPEERHWLRPRSL